MTRGILVAGNWKMNKTNAEARSYFGALLTADLLQNLHSNEQVELLFAAPYTSLQAAREFQKTRLAIAAQNLHWAASGAYTGEISSAQLLEIGISTTLLGHSERRQYFAESDEIVAKKLETCLNQKIRAVVCIGETGAERSAGAMQSVLDRQVDAFILRPESPDNFVIAYEPVWAIGTGVSATTAQAAEAHAYVRKRIANKRNSDFANRVKILYGGSVTAANAQEIMSCADIDGVLVGSASLDPASFSKIIAGGLAAAAGKK